MISYIHPTIHTTNHTYIHTIYTYILYIPACVIIHKFILNIIHSEFIFTYIVRYTYIHTYIHTVVFCSKVMANPPILSGGLPSRPVFLEPPP